jgi:hypothetical protein
LVIRVGLVTPDQPIRPRPEPTPLAIPACRKEGVHDVVTHAYRP